jgi:hypothetical protein
MLFTFEKGRRQRAEGMQEKVGRKMTMKEFKAFCPLPYNLLPSPFLRTDHLRQTKLWIGDF